MRPHLTCTCRPPRARVDLEGECDLAIRAHLATALTSLRQQGCVIVEVDAHAVTFVDASCLRVLHAEAVRLRQAGGALLLVAPSPVFLKVVDLARYRDLLVYRP